MKIKKIVLSLMMTLVIMTTIPMNVFAGTSPWDPGISLNCVVCRYCEITLSSQVVIGKATTTYVDCGVCCFICKGYNGEHKKLGGFLGIGSKDCEAKPNLGAIGVYNSTDVSTIYNMVFNAVIYSNSFSDLKKAFGDGWRPCSAGKLWNHFRGQALSGIEQGRLNGFSPIFRGDHYLNVNSDVRQASWVNGTNTGGLLHFVRFGMNEARNSHPEFNVHTYKNSYSDLQKAFGNNWTQYYRHYVQYGIYEGRLGKPRLVNPTPIYKPGTWQY